LKGLRETRKTIYISAYSEGTFISNIHWFVIGKVQVSLFTKTLTIIHERIGKYMHNGWQIHANILIGMNGFREIHISSLVNTRIFIVKVKYLHWQAYVNSLANTSELIGKYMWPHLKLHLN